ncbi:anti-FecI sigma factor, FecR [Fibrisoma limi BUZ 3]|uniref:Anti-FecI sigma factor, FecR n=1 Tax=Fibrisoma limi BUZ 3 TaxID=1185876 RepID=I2GBG2_9BACT|nr:FecR family protein [Fibrisoma limi]CCH51236.1 anti-FecI sigma factor, FecR [Fibrisoma limi BUZ 3]
MNYHTYSFDELARDEQFRKWVIDRDPASEAFWITWLTDNPDSAHTVQLARAFLLALEEKNTALAPDELEQLTNQVVGQRQRPVIPLWRRTGFKLAASVLLVLGIGYVGLTSLTDKPTSQSTAFIRNISPALAGDYTEIANKTDQVKRIQLQDSSVVSLYPKSSLRYPKQPGSRLREVYLSGRAFFSITKNPRKPFWVYTDKISTQVLGTSFLVSAYPGQREANVEVRSGKVSVYTLKDFQKARQRPGREQNGVVLTPNQRVAYNQTEERLIKTVVQQPVVLAKVQPDELVFDEAPITTVFDQLQKVYGLTVIYDRQTMQHCFLTANLEGELLFDQLNLICRITRSSYELVDGQIIIHSDGCINK